jgi:hypothetical protein
VLKDDPIDARRKRLTVRSDDAAVTVGAGEGTRDDPTLQGATLRVRSRLFDQTYQLPPANWRRRGEKWIYHDARLLSGPISDVLVKAGGIRITGAGAQLGHALPANPDPVTLLLQPGDRGVRQCCSFGGTTTEFRQRKHFRARGAAPPASCDE